jgi:hypothetical protein
MAAHERIEHDLLDPEAGEETESFGTSPKLFPPTPSFKFSNFF